jgi:hypothetical protein
MSEEREEKVEFSGRVPKKERDFFVTTFPQYGSVNWLVNAMLKSFNDRVRHNPSLADQIDQAINDMLKQNRETPA